METAAMITKSKGHSNWLWVSKILRSHVNQYEWDFCDKRKSSVHCFTSRSIIVEAAEMWLMGQ